MTSNPAQQARAVIELARSGRFDEIRRQFPAQLRPLVSAQTLRRAWEAELARWQAGLADSLQVTIRVDPDLDHLLARGSGPSTSAAEDRPQHVDGDIMTSIAARIPAPPYSPPRS